MGKVSLILVGSLVITIALAGCGSKPTNSTVAKIESKSKQPSNQVEQVSYAKYLGKWVLNAETGSAVFLSIDSIDKSNLKGFLTTEPMSGKTSAKAVVQLGGEIVKNQLEFNFNDDGYGNSGEGVLKFDSDGQITVDLKVTEKDLNSKYSTATGIMIFHRNFETIDSQIEKRKEVNMSEDLRRNLSIFFSNFSEALVPPFEKGKLENKDLIIFGVQHVILNNQKVAEPYSDGYKRINIKNIDDAVYKFFGKKISNYQSVIDYKYENGYYIYPIGVGETYSFSQITKLINNGDGCYTAYINIYTPKQFEAYPKDPYALPEKWNMSNDEKLELVYKMKATIKKESDGRFILIDYLEDK